MELEGQYLFRTINIVPYLKQVTLAPATVVGGNRSSGNVLLNEQGGVTVSVSSTNPTVAWPIDNSTGNPISTLFIPASVPNPDPTLPPFRSSDAEVDS